MEILTQHIESLVFTTDKPVTIEEMIVCLEKTFEPNTFQEDVIQEHLSIIQEKYQQDGFSFELAHTGGGYQFLSKSEFHKTISNLANLRSKRKLSNSALETLSIIAYKQPITKVEIEQIRGVSVDYAVQKLLDKELIEPAGRKDAPGQPILYKVSGMFMDYFGINSMAELPKLKDLETAEENEIGEQPQ